MYRLLIVDDEALIRKGLHSIIPWGQLGFAVVGAVGSSAEALAIMERERVDVLLTDIQMPGQNGLLLVEAAKKRLPDIKAVIISGYDRFDYAVSALKLQADDYLLKPLKPEDIKTVFRRIGETLDQEQEIKRYRTRSAYVENEYGILRLIGDELRNLEGFWRHFGGADALVLVLVWYPGGRNCEFWNRLHPLMQDHFCIGTSVLYALFMAEENLELALDNLSRLIAQGGFADVRIVVSQKIRRASDIYQIFLDTTDQMGRARGGEVTRTAPGREGGSIASLKNRLVEDLEQGRLVALDETLQCIFREAGGRDPVQIRMLYSNLLLMVTRYFRLEDTGGLGLLGVEPGPFTEEGLHASLMQDVQYVLEQLRRNSEFQAAVLVRRAREEIDRGYADASFNLAGVADKLNVSYNYLSTLFSKVQGEPLKHYLISVRMERARQLILQRDHKKYQISDMVGYSNPRYFADAFRKYFGASPTEYAQTLGGNQDD